jgi:hypothetical protein
MKAEGVRGVSAAKVSEVRRMSATTAGLHPCSIDLGLCRYRLGTALNRPVLA